MSQIVFEITQEADGGFCAECLTESIFAQGDTWDELRANVKEAGRMKLPRDLSGHDLENDPISLPNRHALACGLH